jgi:hypothetical protein
VIVDLPRLDRTGHAFGGAGGGRAWRDAIGATDADLAALRDALPGATAIVASGYTFATAHTRLSLPRVLDGVSAPGLRVGTVAAWLDAAGPASAALAFFVDESSGEHPLIVDDRGEPRGVRVRAAPGYTLTGDPAAPLRSAPRFDGEHGWDLGAAGHGVLAIAGGTLAPPGGIVAAEEVARLVARALGGD